MELSVIVPAYNERESLPQVLEEIDSLCREINLKSEVLIIDDGSEDGTSQVAREKGKELGLSDFQVIKLRRNFGKGAALAAGFEKARGDWIFTLDGDGQDDPLMFHRLWKSREEGAEVALGWRKNRRDPWRKVLASRVYNLLLSILTGEKFRDINSGMRLFPRQSLEEIDFYGDQYRLLPALFAGQGFSVKEVEVEHRPRQKGKTKYGRSRFLTGLLDIWTVVFLTRFPYRPAHFFGSVGLGLTAVGLAINGYIAYLRLAHGTIQFRYPLLILGVMLMVIGIQFISTGFLAELISFYLYRRRRSYSIKEVFYEEDGDS